MDQMNKVFWKLTNYIQSIKDIKELEPIVKDLTRYSDKDVFQRIKNEIIIEDDWLSFLESKMKFVEAAVFENRQFIREEGEVLPIERIRKVSHTSVTHLARHSDYIEKYTEDEDIIPSKLYTVNKDTDYGVYENKFLYLLLLTISDFIYRCKEDILESVKGLNAKFLIERKNEILGDEIQLSLALDFKSAHEEEILNEVELEKLNRMENVRERVSALLATPLMQIVSREPVISSNITKTNVLTMNENFSNSLELYEYLLNYDKNYFKLEKTVEIVPITSSYAFPLLGVELLISLLKDEKTDDYEIIRLNLDTEEKRKTVAELSKRIDNIKEQYKKDPLAYISLLEEKLSLLEEEEKSIDSLKEKTEKLIIKKNDIEEKNKQLMIEKEGLLSKLKSIEEILKSINAKEDLIRLEYDDKLKEKNNQIQDLMNQIKNNTDEYGNILREKQELKTRNEKLLMDLDNERRKESELQRTYELKIQELEKENEELKEYKRLNEARIKANEVLKGELLSENAETNKESFDELEYEYNAFKKYYDEVWNRTKKDIIKEIKRKKG